MTSTIQQIARIERVIYTIEYDKLPDYLQGIRDMINLLNGWEQKPHKLADLIEKDIQILGGNNDKSK